MAEEKILKDEILKDEELEQVAGGTYRDSSLDLAFMQAIGDLKKEDTAGLATMTRAWAKEGISVVMHDDDKYSNEYYKDGKQISREAAMRTVLKAKGLKNLNLKLVAGKSVL